MINVGFFPAHPAQFWMMKVLSENAPNEVIVHWFIRDKDITLDLLKKFNMPYTLVSSAKAGILRNGLEMLSNIPKFLFLTKKHKIDIWYSKYGAVNIAAAILRIKNFSFNDDDIDVVPLIAYSSYPFASKIFATNWTRMGKFEDCTIRYPSFHELYYLHPNYFKKNKLKAFNTLSIADNKPYILIRLSALEAHHDISAQGVSKQLLRNIINKLDTNFHVFISSEKPLDDEFSSFKLNACASEMHNILACSKFLIADSQTMIAEAAVLGVPSLRVSSFKGKLGYIEELERRGLCWSEFPENENNVLNRVIEFTSHQRNLIDTKHQKLLEETIDPIPFIWKNILQ